MFRLVILLATGGYLFAQTPERPTLPKTSVQWRVQKDAKGTVYVTSTVPDAPSNWKRPGNILPLGHLTALTFTQPARSELVSELPVEAHFSGGYLTVEVPLCDLFPGVTLVMTGGSMHVRLPPQNPQ